MSEDTMIDPNEELDYYVGMSINEVENDLVDKDIVYRIRKDGVVYRDTTDYWPNRVNLLINSKAEVIKAFYG